MKNFSATPERRFFWGALLIGLGLGAFLDNTFLHQLLQWHHLISHRVPPDSLEHLRTNDFADGLLSVLVLALVLVGTWLVRPGYGSVGRAPGMFLGPVILGWGAFNTYDSIVQHWLLQLHHVREDVGSAMPLYDTGFFVAALLLLALGAWLTRRAGRARA